jgi:transposase, IS5 family
MYRRQRTNQMNIDDFILPFGGKLKADNQWIKLAELMPWDEIDKKYKESFKRKSNYGQISIDSRVAFSALYIQMKCGFTDEDTTQNISENPYMQYFLGYKEFSLERPFDQSMMTHFRKRISREFIVEITEKTFAPKNDNKDDNNDNDNNGNQNGGETDEKAADEKPENKGVLMLDATCAPSDITYPTDINLLDEARETLEKVIDLLYGQVKVNYPKKPRTYREEARKNYLVLSKQRKKSMNKIRKVIKSQLQYIERDFRHIDDLVKNGADLTKLRRCLFEKLETCRKFYLQQKKMYEDHTHSVPDRIVSLSQPFVRPIVRGKVNNDVEFGAKISISLIDGFAFIDKLSFNSFNEGILLEEAVENYRRRTGYYPEVILADHIYRNRDNRRFCKGNGIRLSGPRLGRTKEAEEAAVKKQAYDDACTRNAVEGVFGVCKRKYGLSKIMAHLDETTECLIAMNFFVLNMEKKLRLLFAHFLKELFRYSWNHYFIHILPFSKIN